MIQRNKRLSFLCVRGFSTVSFSCTRSSQFIKWPEQITASNPLGREKRLQQYKLITQDQFSKCAGGDRSKLYRSTEQELKQRNVLNLRDALEYICVYMTYKNSQTMKAEESMSETIDRIKNMKYFVSYVQQLWQEVLLAKKVSNSEQQISEAPESLEQVLDSIFYRVFSDESDVPMKHSQTTDMVLLHKMDWPDMYEMATLIALCKYSYVPFCFATTDQQLPYQTYDTLDLSLV